jgi:outer membrane protein
MKKFAFILAIMLIATVSHAQRFAYIDSDYIMENIPEYRAAEDELSRLSIQWQNEIEKVFADVDKMYRDYQAESPLLPEEIRRRREDAIIQKEKDAKELQMKRFGQDGDLFKRRQALVKPIQDRVSDALDDIAKRQNYAMIFDKAGGASLVFADPRYDLSDEVLQKLGYRPGGRN